MWIYRQPGFALHLLCELQKQQQCNLHCDILLQTEGVSIPAHSCVLSALSPVFSGVFAHSPSIPVGQSRLIKLKAVGAHALLKLVGFMYSGVLEAEGFDEQQEVIDVAHKLGFSNLIDGEKMQVNRQPEKKIRWKEIGLQTEETSWGKKDVIVKNLSEKVRFTHSGTQTDSPEAHYEETCLISEHEPSVPLPDELTAVPIEYNSNSQAAGHDWIDDNAFSPYNISKAFVKGPSKRHQIQRDKQRTKIIQKHTGTQISLKFKLKRKMRGALWEIVSVQEELGADGSKICGSSVSERCTADSRLTQGHTEDDNTLTKTQRNITEVQVNPPLTFTCQNLGTVTLTPSSDLTTSPPARPSSECSCLHKPYPVPLSSPLQMPPLSPGLPQSEESEEHIARLLEDMVMMGLNILPSVSKEGNSDVQHFSHVCSHLDSKMEKCEDAATSPAQCYWVHDHNLETGEYAIEKTSGFSGQSEQRSECPASENLSASRRLELNEVASVESAMSFAVTPPCSAPKKDILSLFLLRTDQENVLASNLSFGSEVPHQNVEELTIGTSNLIWSADSDVQVITQGGDCNDSEPVSRMASRNVGQNDVNQLNRVIESNSHLSLPARTQRPDELLKPSDTIDQVLHQPPAIDQASHTSCVVHFSEMRIPKCLSPLASEELQFGTFSQDPEGLLNISNVLGMNLKPPLTNSPQQQCLPDKQNSLSTTSNVKRTLSSEVELSPYYSRSTKERIKVATGCELEHVKKKGQTFESLVVKGTERILLYSQSGMSEKYTDNEAHKRKSKMLSYISSADVQSLNMVKPCSINKEAVSHIDKTHSLCASKVYSLKAKACERASTDQSPQEKLANDQTNQPKEFRVQDKCIEDVCLNQSGFVVEKPESERSSKKRKCAEDLEQSLSKVKKLNSLHAEFKASKYNDSLLAQEHVHKEENGLVPEQVVVNPVMELGYSSKLTLPLGLAQTIKNLDRSSTTLRLPTNIDHHDLQKAKIKEKAQEAEMRHAPLELEKAVSAFTLNKDESIQPHTYARSATRPSVFNKIFHQSSFSPGTTVKESFLPQQLRLSLQNSEKLDAKNGSNSKHENGCLLARKLKEIEVKQLDEAANTGIYSASPDLSKKGELTPHSYTVLLAKDSNNNLEMESNPQREATKIGDCKGNMISESFHDSSVSNGLIEVPSDRTKDLQHTAAVNTQIVISESLYGLSNEKAVKVITFSETKIRDIEVDLMDGGAQVTTSTEKQEAAVMSNTDEIDVEESPSCVGMDGDGAVACEEELRKLNGLGSKVKVIPSDEDESWWSDHSNSPVPPFGINPKSAKNSSCNEEEEVNVDDLPDEPHVLSCSLSSSRFLIILTDDENDWEEEEEEVDVTGVESD